MNNKAIGYVRCSTDKQEASIPEQKKSIQGYAQKHSLEIIRWFEDEGKSGRNAEERPAFMEMINHIKICNDFKFVLVYDVSRWGRFENPKEATYWEVECEKHGKKIKYCTEGHINDDSMGAFISKVVKDSEASEYSSKLSKTSFRGHKHYAEKGYVVGGSAKYGYKRMLIDENGNFVKIMEQGEHKATKTQHCKYVKGDVEAVKTIQRIYDMSVNKNFGISSICNVLNSEDVPSPRNKGWSKSTVWAILHDETYIGWIVWNRNVYKNLHEKDKGWRKYKPSTEWVICKDAHEPIIDEALFRAVQAKTRQAYKGGYKLQGKGRGYYTPYLLSGIMKCIKCKSNYQGRRSTSKTQKKVYESRYYVCGTYSMKDNCKRWNVPKDIAESTALDFIIKRLNNPLWLKSIRSKLVKKAGVIKNESMKEVEKIDSELTDVQNRIARLTDAVERGYDNDVASDRIRGYISKRDRLLDMRSSVDSRSSSNLMTTGSLNQIMSRMKRFKKEFEKAEIPAKKMMLAKFIHEIRVDPNEHKCYYYMKKIPDFFSGGGSVDDFGVKFGVNPHHHRTIRQVPE